ncbi:hypothetical protein, partial [Bacillus subtilis]
MYPQIIDHLNPLTLPSPSTLHKHLNVQTTPHTSAPTKVPQLVPKP